MYITANDLKTRGTAVIEEKLDEDSGLSVLVRGKRRFVIVEADHYDRLREYELMAALAEAKADIAAGRYTTDVDGFLKQLRDAL